MLLPLAIPIGIIVTAVSGYALHQELKENSINDVELDSPSIDQNHEET